ncbi:MAG TPA: hypothetical protein VFW71_13220 [Actinomycetota bacterium]|nr:hypothetical protein [Actinomycetota bacterium]
MRSNEDDEASKDATSKLPKEGANALSALRNLWGATGREAAFFMGEDRADREASIGRATMESAMGGIGFGGLDTFAEENEATHNTHAAGQRLSAAWKKTMEREGKMLNPGQSVSDLIANTREGGLPGPNDEDMEVD